MAPHRVDGAWSLSRRRSDYGVAVAAVAAALGLRQVLNPMLGQQGPYIVLTFAVVVAALRGGVGPAAFATLLGAVAGNYTFLVQGQGLADVWKPQNAWRTGLFLCMGVGTGFVGGRLLATQRALGRTVLLLQASNRAKDQAMAVLGHEIRNPLSALHTAQRVLQRASHDPARVQWASDVIQRQVDHMARMADDLVDLSGVMRGEFRVDRVPLDLQAVVEQALEQTAALMARKGHRMDTDFGSARPQVLGDNMRLVQVFANLLNNAAKYTEAGGALSVRIGGAAHGQAEVVVADNGMGMRPESIAGLFEPFVRAPAASAHTEGGLGLGLSLVRRIVEAHGGTVHAESAGPGSGSRFVVRLPLA